MTRWLVTGAGGMLGRDLTALLDAAGEEFAGLTRAELDITDAATADAVVAAARPDGGATCAAWTAVDAAEEQEDEALAVNGRGAANLAAACAAAGAVLVQPSTDYVFDGTASTPYAEDAPTAPAGAYGRTKLAGEQAVRAALPDASYIVRTAWLYGAHGKNFVKTMLRLAGNGTSPGVVADQHGQPTWTADVAAQVYALVEKAAPPGVYHATSSGETTWYGFAEAVFARYHRAQDISGAKRELSSPRPVTTAEYPTPARRPAYSVLGHDAWSAAGMEPIGDWRDALDRAFPEVAGRAADGGERPRAAYRASVASLRCFHHHSLSRYQSMVAASPARKSP